MEGFGCPLLSFDESENLFPPSLGFFPSNELNFDVQALLFSPAALLAGRDYDVNYFFASANDSGASRDQTFV